MENKTHNALLEALTPDTGWHDFASGIAVGISIVTIVLGALNIFSEKRKKVITVDIPVSCAPKGGR